MGRKNQIDILIIDIELELNYVNQGFIKSFTPTKKHGPSSNTFS